MDMDKPMFRITDMRHLVEICKKLSKFKKTIKSWTLRTYYAEMIFDKLSLSSSNFLKVWPEGDCTFDLVDTSSIASIARNFIEVHDVLYYFCEKNLSEDEFNLRVSVADLHHSKELKRILKRFNFSETILAVDYANMSEFYSRTKIEENPLFQSYSSKLQKSILKGTKAYDMKLLKKKDFPIEEDIKLGVYKLLSNSIHSFLLGVVNNSPGSMDSPVSQINILFFSMEVSIIYLASSADMYCKLRSKLASNLTTKERNFIKEMTSDKYLKQWLERLREKNHSVV